MKRQQLIESNPLRLLSPAGGGPVAGRHLALIKAAPGTGKTAILVQVALDKLLRGEQVVHVGINDHLNNIKLWYSQVFAAVARQAQVEDSARLEAEIMGRRLLMTFMAENFTPQQLAQRLDDFSRHGIELPDCLVIDGLAGSQAESDQVLAELKTFAQERKITIWVSCAGACSLASQEADTILELSAPKDGLASLSVVKDGAGYAEVGASIHLDPQTLTLCL